MKLEKLWEGKLPPYWDITTWAVLAEHRVVVCYRELGTRKRILEVFDLLHGISSKEESVYNAILGTLGTAVYPALITDARSHIQINRMTKYDIISRSAKWSVSEPFLVEKYKISYMTYLNAESYNLGNKRINLYSGEVSSSKKPFREQGWIIGNGLRLEQQGTVLVCLNSQQETLWSKTGYLGSWYHGVRGQLLYFMLPDGHLVVIDRTSGEELVRVFLTELKTVTGRVSGSFDFKNDRSFDNCTIADVLIHDDLVMWVTGDNRLATCNLQTGKVFISNEAKGEYDICLSAINSEYFLLYDIRDADYGRLLLSRWRN
jgi:hypothetical protein